MIQLFQFRHKNSNGEKERRLTQEITLINKLSAEEVNDFRDKLNEVITKLNLFKTTPFRVVQELVTLRFTIPIWGNISTILNKTNPSQVVYYNEFELTSEIEIIKNAEIGDTIEILFN